MHHSPEPLLSVVVPVFNEGEVLRAFHQRLAGVIDQQGVAAELLYVNDGSTDEGMEIMKSLQRADGRVTIVNLSRNFGKEAAMTAGLNLAKGQAIVIIDADLQDPPEVIPALLHEWRRGHDVVYARRVSRDGETALKRLSSHLFYRFISLVSSVSIPKDTGDFRLLSRRAVDSLNGLNECHRFMKGLYAWIGFSQKEVAYHRDPRYAGETKWNYWKLWNFALEGITSFTTFPLKVATYLGLTTALGSFSYGVFVISKTLLYGDPVKGYPSLMVVILFIGSVQLMALGVIGEYLARMFDETKRRPLYLIESYSPFRGEASTEAQKEHRPDNLNEMNKAVGI